MLYVSEADALSFKLKWSLIDSGVPADLIPYDLIDEEDYDRILNNPTGE